MTTKNGRWKNARDWLKEQVRRWDTRKLERKFHELADNYSEHELQVFYAKDLEADDFFRATIDPAKVVVGAEVRIAKWTDCDHLAGKVGVVRQVVLDRTLAIRVEFTHLRSDENWEWFSVDELTEVE